MHAERRHARPRLRALELIEERALGGKPAGSLYLTGAITPTAITVVTVASTGGAASAGLGRSRASSCAAARARPSTPPTRDFALDSAAVA
jgi:hypothetical protein